MVPQLHPQAGPLLEAVSQGQCCRSASCWCPSAHLCSPEASPRTPGTSSCGVRMGSHLERGKHPGCCWGRGYLEGHPEALDCLQDPPGSELLHHLPGIKTGVQRDWSRPGPGQLGTPQTLQGKRDRGWRDSSAPPISPSPSLWPGTHTWGCFPLLGLIQQKCHGGWCCPAPPSAQ